MLWAALALAAAGGATSLTALFHLHAKSTRERLVARDDLARREREFGEYCERANAALDAKRASLESLTRRANDAARALADALESTSAALGRARSVGDRVDAPFEFADFDARVETPKRRAAR